MRRKIIANSIIIFVLGFLCVNIFNDSYANRDIEEKINLELYDNIDDKIFMDNIKYFIDLVDEDIILNSSYNLSNKLNENYDFLTMFAISFILNNEGDFNIIYGNDYVYTNQYGNQYKSNKYISLDDIYNVTNKIFGIDYYYITDKNLLVDEDKVVLVDIYDKEIKMVLEDIVKINNNGNSYDVYVKYLDNDLIYVYKLDKTIDNRLFISNLSIEG